MSWWQVVFEILWWLVLGWLVASLINDWVMRRKRRNCGCDHLDNRKGNMRDMSKGEQA